MERLLDAKTALYRPYPRIARICARDQDLDVRLASEVDDSSCCGLRGHIKIPDDLLCSRCWRRDIYSNANSRYVPQQEDPEPLHLSLPLGARGLRAAHSLDERAGWFRQNFDILF
jgi:hypothetical protein